MFRVKRFFFEYIQAGPGNFVFLQSTDQGRFIYDRAAGGVDEERCFFHQTEFMFTDAVDGFLCGRHMKRDIVAGAKDFVAVVNETDIVRNLSGKRIIGQHFHVKAEMRFFCHEPADIACADESQGFALQLGFPDPHFCIAVIFHTVVHDRFKAAGAVQHVKYSQLRYGYSVGPSGRCDKDFVLFRGLKVHSVIAGPVAGYDPELFRGVQDTGGNFCCADNHCVAVCDIGNDIFFRKSAAADNFKAVFQEKVVSVRQDRLGQ